MHAHDRNTHEQEPRAGDGGIRRVPPGTFRAGPAGSRRAEDRREPERPALVMVVAPLLGASIWGAILFLLLA